MKNIVRVSFAVCTALLLPSAHAQVALQDIDPDSLAGTNTSTAPDVLAARIAVAAQLASSTNAAFLSPAGPQVSSASGGVPPPSPARWVAGVDNTFSAADTPFPIVLADTLDTPGCLSVVIPGTEPAATLRGTILALAYIEPGENGRSATIGQVKSSPGQLVGENRVIFRDAFDGEGVTADVAYELPPNSRSVMQNVIIRGRLPEPEDYGLSSESALVVVTEFFDAPPPSQQSAADGKPDVGLRWGPLAMIRGKAFALGDEMDGGVSVDKSWVETTDGRVLLLESVPHRQIKARLQALPELHGSLGPSSRPEVLLAATGSLFRPLPLLEPPVLVCPLAADTLLRDPAEGGDAGFVIDYVVSDAALINIDFCSGGATKSGFAAVGQSTADIWNLFNTAGNGTLTLTGLRWSDGSNSGASVTAANAPGSWSFGCCMASIDAMYDGYLYNYGDVITVTLNWLPPDTYDLYLYGHGPVQNANTLFTLGGTTRPTSATGTYWNTADWHEDEQYVVFRGVTVAAGQSVALTAGTGVSGYAQLNGMQIVPSSGLTPPPTITSQPQDATVGAGGSASFTVGATGTAPLTYRWYKNGDVISGAVGPTYTIVNVQASDAATYSAAVLNAGGTTLSRGALLTVTTPGCAAPSGGVVAWWPSDNSTVDLSGAHPVSFYGGATYGTAVVGLGLSLNGAGSYAEAPRAPDLDVGTGDGLTVEGWVEPLDPVSRPIFEWSDSTAVGVHMWANYPSSGWVYVNLSDTAGGVHSTSAGGLATGTFTHVAVTYDKAGGTMKLYLNGSLAQTYNCGTFTPQTALDFYLGYRPSQWWAGTSFNGLLDEFSVYNQVLSGTAINAIFTAGTSGKCKTAPPGHPSIISQPVSQTAAGGANASFSVNATGTLPLTYQWFRNGAALPGAAGSSLSLSAVTLADAGDYKVVVSNPYGSATSSSAILTVNQVATPAFSPAGGSYGSAQNVAITCSTPGATIHYRLDGQEPTQTDPSTSPVLIDHSLTLKAKAWKSGYTTSDTETESYRIEATPTDQPPTVTISPPTGTSLLASDDLPLLVEASDADGAIVRIQLYRDGVKVAESVQSPLQFTLSQLSAGTYTFTAKAIDDAGFTAVSAPVGISVNASGPVVSLQGAQPIYTSSPATLYASVVGVNPGSIASLTLNGSRIPAGTGSLTLSQPLVEGANTFTLVATDDQGRSSQAATTVYLDSTAPIISISAPANNSSFSVTRINVSGTFTEASLKGITVNSVPAFVNGSAFEALNVPLAVGANTVTAQAEDLAGNVSTASINVTGAANPVDPVQLQATPVGGFTPLQVTFTVQASVPGTLQQVLYDFTGDDTASQTATDLQPVTHTYAAPGEYFPVVTLVTTAGRFSSPGGWNSTTPSRLRINVQSPPVTLNTISVIDPVDLKATANGHFVVLSRSTATITEYDASLAVFRSKSNIGTTPTGLDVDINGNVYAALSGDHKVAKFNPVTDTLNPDTRTFKLDSTFGNGGFIGKSDGTSGAGNGEFNAPYDVAVSADGTEIAVSDSGNHRIQRFRSTDGTFVSSFGSQGSEIGQFNRPKGLAFDSVGYLYIVDSLNNRIVLVFDSGVLGARGTSGTGLGQFQNMLNLAVGGRRIYVADTGNNRVQCFDPIPTGHGAIQTPLSPRSALSAEMSLSQPNAVATVRDFIEERIYIADTGNNRVILVKLPSDGPAPVWNGMVDRIVNHQDIPGAISNFSRSSAEKYRNAFLAIGVTALAQDISPSQTGTVAPVFIDADTAQYRFSQILGGYTILFTIDFVKENGAWRIEAF